ncbi:MAG: hypothetical protein ACLRZ7_03765 [Lachnospiraceae bacterium]
MRKTKIIAALFLFVLGLTSCGKQLALPNNPKVFTVGYSKESYISLAFEDKEYVPYCALEPSQLGECIGYYKEDGEMIYVCTLKGQSADEWIVDVLNLDNCREGMVFREINTTVIPEGLESDYPWNK